VDDRACGEFRYHFRYMTLSRFLARAQRGFRNSSGNWAYPKPRGPRAGQGRQQLAAQKRFSFNFAELAEAGRRARAIRCTAARTHRGASDEGFGFPSNRGDTTTGFHGTSAN